MQSERMKIWRRVEKIWIRGTRLDVFGSEDLARLKMA